MEKDEKLRLQTIRQAGIRYKQISLWLTAAVALAVLFACRLSAQCDDMIAQVVNPLVVSAIFSLIARLLMVKHGRLLLSHHQPILPNSIWQQWC